METSIELTCTHCSTGFTKRLATYRQALQQGRETFFCSRACSAAHKRQTPETANCRSCGEGFHPAAPRQIFCSRSCAARYNNSASPKRRKNHEMGCSSCEKERDTLVGGTCFSCRVSNGGDPTLSDIRSTRQTISFHTFIRYRSRTAYIKSGKPMECVVCGYSAHVDISHIKSVKEFDPSTRLSVVNGIENLVALCKNHHWELDHGLLLLPRLHEKSSRPSGGCQDQEANFP